MGVSRQRQDGSEKEAISSSDRMDRWLILAGKYPVGSGKACGCTACRTSSTGTSDLEAAGSRGGHQANPAGVALVGHTYTVIPFALNPDVRIFGRQSEQLCVEVSAARALKSFAERLGEAIGPVALGYADTVLDQDGKRSGK